MKLSFLFAIVITAAVVVVKGVSVKSLKSQFIRWITGRDPGLLDKPTSRLPKNPTLKTGDRPKTRTAIRILLKATRRTDTTPFQANHMYTYKYNAVVKVVNPIVPNEYTSVKLDAMVDFYFTKRSGYMGVVMQIQAPTLKIAVLDPKKSSNEMKTSPLIHPALKTSLLQPIRFNYAQGLIHEVFHRKGESTWSVNIKKGIIHMFIVNYHGNDDDAMFTRDEKTIHGQCTAVYTQEKIPHTKIVNIKKTIDLATCKDFYGEVFSSVIPNERESNTEVKNDGGLYGFNTNELPTKGMAVVEFDIVKTSTGIKIKKAKAIGTVSFHLLQSNDAIASVTEQTLILVKEYPESSYPETHADMLEDTFGIVMDVNKILIKVPHTPKQLKTLSDTILTLLKTLKVDIKEPFSKKTTKELLGLVQTLRQLNVEELSVIWGNVIPVVQDHEWFVYLLSLVKTNAVMTVVFNNLEANSTILADELINEFVSMIGTTQFVEYDMIKRTQTFCNLPFVLGNKMLKHTCFIAYADLMKAFCHLKPRCPVEPPPVLRQMLKTIASMKTMSDSEHTEEDMVKCLIAAETTESLTLYDSIVAISSNIKLPMQVRVRAILALRPFVLRKGNALTNPLFELFRTRHNTFPEEVRLAAFTVLMEHPTISIVFGVAQHLTLEPSMTIRRFVFDTLVTMSMNRLLPESITSAATNAKDHLIAQRTIPLNTRWLLQNFVKVIRPIKGKDTIAFVFHNQMHYTKTELLPKRIMSKLDLKLMGNTINVLDMDARLEGVQNLLLHLVGIIPRSEKLYNKLKTMTFSDKDTFDKAFNPTAGDNLKLFVNMKLFGKQWTTYYKKTSLEISKLLPDNLVSIVETVKKLDKGMDFEFVKPMMPVEVAAYMSTCAGITLVHQLTTMVISRMKTNVVAKAELSLVKFKALLLPSLDMVNANVTHRQRTDLWIRGKVFFDTPIGQCGLQCTHAFSANFDTKLSTEYSKKTDTFRFDVTPPMFNDILTAESEIEGFVNPLMPTDTNVIRTRLVPEQLMDHVRFVNVKIDSQGRHSKMYISVGKGLYIGHKRRIPIVTRYNRMKFLAIQHGRDGRICTFYVPWVGYLRVHPKTKALVFDTVPTYFLMTYISENEVTLQTLVRRNKPRKKLPENSNAKLAKLEEFMNIFREANFEIEEFQFVYKMLNDDFLANEVTIMGVVLDGKTLKLKERSPSVLNLKVFMTTENDLKAHAMDADGLCVIDGICLHGYLPAFNGDSGMSSCLTPMFVKFVVNQGILRLGRIRVFHHKTSKHKYTTQINLLGHKAARYSLVTVNTPRLGKLTMKLYKNGFLRSHKRMCFNMNYLADTFAADISLNRMCSTKNFKVALLKSASFPRFHYHLEWSGNYIGLSKFWLNTVFLLQDYIILPILRKPSFVPHESLFADEVPIWKAVEQCPYTRLTKGNVIINIPTPNVAKVRFESTARRFTHKLYLPIEIESLPMGTVSNPLVMQVIDLIKPGCKYNDNTFKTFDGLKYINIPDYNCEQVLVKSCGLYSPTFMVTSRNGGTDFKTLRIMLNDIRILIQPHSNRLVPDIHVKHKRITLKKNIYKTTLPGNLHLKITFDPKQHILEVQNIELGLRVTLVAGKSVYIRLSPMLFDKVCGMCGNMNTFGEFVTREQIPVTDPALFALSWTLPDSSCKAGCPLVLTKDVYIPLNPSKCSPLVNLPTCRTNCSKTISKRRLYGVPMQCKNHTTTVDLLVPIKCKCLCKHCTCKPMRS